MRLRLSCLVLAALGCSAPSTPAFSSGLAAERTIASLDASEVSSFCLARIAWIDTVLDPGWQTDVACLPRAMLRTSDPSACETERASCAATAPPFDASAICADTHAKPACDPIHTVGELERCWEEEIVRFTTYTCDVAGTPEAEALVNGSSPACRAIFADPDCNFFAP